MKDFFVCLTQYLLNHQELQVAVGNRIYPHLLPQNPALPSIVYIPEKVTTTIHANANLQKVMSKKGIKCSMIRKDYNFNSNCLTNVMRGNPIGMGSAERIAEILGVKVKDIFVVQTKKEKYAYETIHKIKRSVRAVLSCAKKQRLIVDNYASADYIDFPKRPSTEIDCNSKVSNHTCSCPAHSKYSGPCKHIVALLFAIQADGKKYDSSLQFTQEKRECNLHKQKTTTKIERTVINFTITKQKDSDNEVKDDIYLGTKKDENSSDYNALKEEPYNATYGLIPQEERESDAQKHKPTTKHEAIKKEPDNKTYVSYHQKQNDVNHNQDKTKNEREGCIMFIVFAIFLLIVISISAKSFITGIIGTIILLAIVLFIAKHS